MIGGGVKFFSKSKNLGADGATILASSGDGSSDRAIDRNPITYWRSVSSNDLTAETITITFASAQTFDRLFLLDHNWKDFNVKYFSGGSYTHFASVTGLDGSKSNITETAFADSTAYYEFTQVTTTSIQITVTKTQTVDAEKYIAQIICCSELGTLQGYPDVSGLEHDRNARSKQMLSGKMLTLKSEESFACKLVFKTYPASLSDDIDLMFTLYDKEENFMIWLCGGRRGSTYFKKQLKGYRLQDLYTVQTNKPIKPDYSKNIYMGTVNFDVTFNEAVD